MTRSKWTLQTAEGEDTRALVAAKERSELQELRKRKEERRQAEEEKDRLQKEADRRESMVKQVKERQTKRKEALLASTSAKRPPKLPPEQPLVIRRERAKDGVWIKCSSGHWRLATEDEVVADSSNALREASIMYRDAENSRLRELAQVRWRALTTTTH